jgi:hypothetical protein
MKQLARHLLISLGIATPLWLRQYRVERKLAKRQTALERETVRFADGVKDTIEYGAKSWNRWGDELVKEVQRAVRGEARLR